MLGGDFLSRINMDLRETKGWSYGVSGNFGAARTAVPYIVSAPVQADRTGDRSPRSTRRSAASSAPRASPPKSWRGRSTNSISELPGRFETSGAVLAAMMSNDLLGRPDNYYETLAAAIAA